MSTRLLLEGPDLEELLAKIKEEHGAAARIVSAERVRTGGLVGFFAKQRFEIAVDILDPEEAGASTDEDVPPTADGLAALLARAEAQERELDESERAPRTAARFAQVLAERESGRAPRPALPSAGVFQGVADETPEADRGVPSAGGRRSLAARPVSPAGGSVSAAGGLVSPAGRSGVLGHRASGEAPIGRVGEGAAEEQAGRRTPEEFLTTRTARRVPADAQAGHRSPAQALAAPAGGRTGAGEPGPRAGTQAAVRADGRAALAGERAYGEQPARAGGRAYAEQADGRDEDHTQTEAPIAHAGERADTERPDGGQEHRAPVEALAGERGAADDEASGARPEGSTDSEAGGSPAGRGAEGSGDGAGAQASPSGVPQASSDGARASAARNARPLLSEPSVAAKLAERARRRAAELAAEAAANEERAAVRRNGRIRIVSGPGSEGPGADGTPPPRAAAERSARNSTTAAPAADLDPADAAVADPPVPARAGADSTTTGRVHPAGPGAEAPDRDQPPHGYHPAAANPGSGHDAAYAQPGVDEDDDHTAVHVRPVAKGSQGEHGRLPFPAAQDEYDLDEPVTAEMQRPVRASRPVPPAPPASSRKRVTGTAAVTGPPVNGAAPADNSHPTNSATGRATVRPAALPDDPPTAAQPIRRMPPKPTTRSGYDHPAVQLVRNGVPVHIAARAVGPDPWTAVARAVAGLPYPPALPSRAGEVLVIVGETESALLVAGQIAALSASIDPSATLVAGSIAGTGLRRSHRISSPDEATRRGLELHTATGPRIVVVEATAGSPIGRASAVTSSADVSPRAMITALAPTQVWACVDATRKNADTARFLDALERVDALAVHGADQTVEPGSVLHFGLPVVMLDGRPATARRWTTLLCERLTGGPLPGDGEGPIAPIMPLELPAGRRGAHAAIVEEPVGSRRTTHRAPEAAYVNGYEQGGY